MLRRLSYYLEGIAWSLGALAVLCAGLGWVWADMPEPEFIMFGQYLVRCSGVLGAISLGSGLIGWLARPLGPEHWKRPED